jgi:hypothetical protein
MNAADMDNEPWHRQFWPWFLIALPAVAVVGSFAMLFISIKHAPELVVPDYERIAETIQQQAARDKQATILGLNAQIEFKPAATSESRLAIVMLSGNADAILPDTIVLKSLHSTLQSMDTETQLTGSQGHYAGEVPQFSGSYTLTVTDIGGTWRLNARAYGQPARVAMKPYRAAADVAQQ